MMMLSFTCPKPALPLLLDTCLLACFLLSLNTCISQSAQPVQVLEVSDAASTTLYMRGAMELMGYMGRAGMERRGCCVYYPLFVTCLQVIALQCQYGPVHTTDRSGRRPPKDVKRERLVPLSEHADIRNLSNARQESKYKISTKDQLPTPTHLFLHFILDGQDAIH